MTKRATFAATYSDWKLIRTRKVVQIVFEVPVENADDAYSVLGGMPNSGEEIWCAVARLKESAAMADAPPASAPSPSNAPAGGATNRLTKRAGILCNDPLFHKYLTEKEAKSEFPVTFDKVDATQYLRKFCNVESRKEIVPGTHAALRFDLIESAFVCWREKDAVVEQ